MKKRSCRHSGYSLLELSIVLVVIGLIIGAVVGGQHLIRTMRLRQITKEYDNYQAAILSFADKYNALPGDMNNATTYWSSSVNGTGEWIIGDRDNPAQDFERFRAWQHLALSGMISGAYTGVAGSGGSRDHDLGENAPQSVLPNSGWGILQISNYASNTNDNNPFFNRKYGNLLMFGGARATSIPDNAIITPQEALQIDSKIDDGSPVTGIVSAILSSWAPERNCTTADGKSFPVQTTPAIAYNNNIQGNACVLLFLLPEDVRGPNG